HPAGTGESRVVEPAADEAGSALHLLDVPVDARVEREQVRPVDGDRVVLQVEQVDVLRRLGEEHLAGTGHLHQLRALARNRLLHHPAEPAAPGVLEGHVALVGDHRTGLRLDRDLVQAHLQQLRVLERERLLRLRLLELTQSALHLASFDVVGSEGREEAKGYALVTLGSAPLEGAAGSSSSAISSTDSTEVLRRPSEETSSLK